MLGPCLQVIEDDEDADKVELSADIDVKAADVADAFKDAGFSSGKVAKNIRPAPLQPPPTPVTTGNARNKGKGRGKASTPQKKAEPIEEIAMDLKSPLPDAKDILKHCIVTSQKPVDSQSA